MRVLWFSNTPSNYSVAGSPHNGGGWVSALEDEIAPKVTLGVCFTTCLSVRQLHCRQVRLSSRKVRWGKDFQHAVTYYPVFNGFDRTRSDRIASLLRGFDRQDEALVRAFQAVVEDFRPDVIQVFGSEHAFGLVASRTKIPVVLHVQGIVNPSYKAFLPPGASWRRYILTPLRPALAFQKIYTRLKWIHACERERQIFQSVRHYLGRTAWDHEQVRLFRPDAVFHQGDELMRQAFYDADIDAISALPSRLTLVTTISEPPYKGFDLVLRTARLLRTEYGLDFQWKVFGDVSPLFFERLTGISLAESGVTLAGVTDAAGLVEAIAQATMYVHPSYIDNSSNSVCEAQLLGAAVVATAVGGVPSLIDDGRTGFLVRSGSPEEMAERIVALFRGRQVLRAVGRNARREALARHDRVRIVTDLLVLYESLA